MTGRISTRGELMELFPGEGNYVLVKIPPQVWNGFKGRRHCTCHRGKLFHPPTPSRRDRQNGSV